MIVEFETSFSRDLKNIKDRALLARIKAVIQAVEEATTLQEFPNLIKLHGQGDYFRIRVGDYRLGLSLENEAVVFMRCMKRSDIYRNFPQNMNKIAYLFPGQGSQAVGMGQDLCAHSEAARQVFDEADQYLGTKISTICFYGPEETLRQTVNTQPALFVTSVAAFKALQEAGAPMPQAVAGHSVGEYAALVAAGALDLETGLHLVSRRAQAMHRAALAQPGAMAAILGLSAADVVAACEEAGPEQVQAANFNGGGQVVISGTPEGVAQASEIAKAKGAKRVVPLNVSGAFHSRLMAPAAHSMEITLADVNVREAAVPVVANLTAEYETHPEDIKANLAAQIDHPVRWEESIGKLVQDGYNAFVEVGPGNVLAGLMKRLAPGATVYTVGDSAGVAAFVSAQAQN